VDEDLNSFQKYVLRIVNQYPGIKRSHPRLFGSAQAEIDPLVEAGRLTQTPSGKLKIVEIDDHDQNDQGPT
jgi:hypothetical protein